MYFFPATVHASPTATVREEIVSRDIENGPNSILGNLLPVSAGIGHRRFEVLAKYPEGHPEVALFESFSRYILRLLFMMESFELCFQNTYL